MPAVTGMESWKKEVQERVSITNSDAKFRGTMGRDCSAVNRYLHDVLAKFCFDFLLKLEGIPESSQETNTAGRVVKVYDIRKRKSGLAGNGGIRITGMWIL